MQEAVRSLHAEAYFGAHWSHIYPEGACQYMTLRLPPMPEDEAFVLHRQAWDRLQRICLELGGSIAHHHGVGVFRNEWLREELGVGLDLLQILKDGIDPQAGPARRTRCRRGGRAGAMNARATLRNCAFCPNTCRPSHPADAPQQTESQTPSAMSLMALAHLDGRLDADSGVLQALQRRDAVRASLGHCTYGFDIDAALDAALGK